MADAVHTCAVGIIGTVQHEILSNTCMRKEKVYIRNRTETVVSHKRALN